MPKQHVGEDHPSPGRGPDQQQRHRDADQPPGHQYRLAAVAIRQGAGEEVGGRLHDAERGDEGQRGGERREPELGFSEKGENGSFLADHAPDEGVDCDQQGELGQVLA